MSLTRLFKFYEIVIEDETEIVVPTDNKIYSAKIIWLMKYHLVEG